MSEAARVPQSVRTLLAFVLLWLVPAVVHGLAVELGMPGVGHGVWPHVGSAVGVVLFVVMACRLPPAVALWPVRAGSALSRYLPFAALWLLFALAYLHASDALGHSIRPQPMLEHLAQHGLAGESWLLLLAAVAIAPVVEELFFRGYLLGALLPVLPSWQAQLLTAGIFGLVHGVDYALPIAALGWFFGWLRLRHRSLGPAILAHAVHNGLVFATVVLWPTSLQLMYPR